MISLSTLANILEEKLNENSEGLKFKINADTGVVKKAKKNINTVTEYINGELRLTSSDLTNLTNGLIVATQNCKLDVIVRLEDEEEDYQDKVFKFDKEGNIVEEDGTYVVGNNTKIANVRKALETAFQNNDNEPIQDGDKEFSVTTIYQLANSGIRDQVSGLGNSYTFSVYIFYMFVENGINTKDSTFYLDGLLLPLEMVSIFRSPTMDGVVPLNTTNGAVKNISSMSSFSITIDVPAIVGQNPAFFSYLFDGDLNSAHILKVEIKGQTYCKLVCFGENKLSGETIKNMGQTLTFVECPDEYDLINIAKGYIYRANTGFFLEDKKEQVYNFTNRVFYNGKDTIYVYKGDILWATDNLKLSQLDLISYKS